MANPIFIDPIAPSKNRALFKEFLATQNIDEIEQNKAYPFNGQTLKFTRSFIFGQKTNKNGDTELRIYEISKNIQQDVKTSPRTLKISELGKIKHKNKAHILKKASFDEYHNTRNAEYLTPRYISPRTDNTDNDAFLLLNKIGELDMLDAIEMLQNVEDKDSVDILLARILLAEGLVRGLSRFQQKGLIHGDIKPENFVLCHDGTIRLIDFESQTPIGSASQGGIAKHTAEYVPPEFYKNTAARKYDNFSMGMALKVLFNGYMYLHASEIGCPMTSMILNNHLHLMSYCRFILKGHTSNFSIKILLENSYNRIHLIHMLPKNTITQLCHFTKKKVMQQSETKSPINIPKKIKGYINILIKNIDNKSIQDSLKTIYQSNKTLRALELHAHLEIIFEKLKNTLDNNEPSPEDLYELISQHFNKNVAYHKGLFYWMTEVFTKDGMENISPSLNEKITVGEYLKSEITALIDSLCKTNPDERAELEDVLERLHQLKKTYLQQSTHYSININDKNAIAQIEQGCFNALYKNYLHKPPNAYKWYDEANNTCSDEDSSAIVTEDDFGENEFDEYGMTDDESNSAFEDKNNCNESIDKNAQQIPRLDLKKIKKSKDNKYSPRNIISSVVKSGFAFLSPKRNKSRPSNNNNDDNDSNKNTHRY